MLHVPYKGAGPALTALLGGEIQVMVVPPVIAVAHIKSGRMNPLAVAGAKRLPALPGIPTLEEAGVPLVVDSFWGLVAPAGTSAATIGKLQEGIAKVLFATDMKARLEDMQFQAVGSAPAQFETFVQSEVKRWMGVVKATGVKVE